MRRSGDPRSTPRVGGTERPEWLYIAFEGGEGSGKSTQAERLASRLGAVLTREPGGTAIGGRLRELLLDPSTEDLDARAETLLMAADRAQHRAEVVAPTLASGRHVVSDRSVYSSLAYQGGGRGLDLDTIRSISRWALDGYWPDLVVFLDLDPEMARQRLAGRRLDRFELEDAAFSSRLRDTFADLAAAEPRRWVTVSGSSVMDMVTADVDAAVGAWMGRHS